MNIVRKCFNWIFKKQLLELQNTLHEAEKRNKQLQVDIAKLQNIFKNIDVSVDVHQYSPSWAVISIQGEGSDYIKFIDLGRSDMMAIQRFLRQFDRGKIDAHPYMAMGIKKALWRIDKRKY